MTLLLAIIYIAFISLGLPDALLGSAWPSMQPQLNVPVSYAGIIAMIISAGTILSSLFSDKLTTKLGTGKITAISVALTAISLFGFSIAPSFLFLCFLSIPYGIGAGAVDAALNNYVALHYKASHMSFLHCFWGVGATIGPFVMGACLTGGLSYTSGYWIISVFQVILTIILIATLSLWKDSGKDETAKQPQRKLSMFQLFKLPGANAALLSFFCYCALEQTAGLWGASYMVLNRGLSENFAAKLASLFYLGITAGRFLCGFITMKLNSKTLIYLGIGTSAFGIALLCLPLGTPVMCVGFILIGVGCAPVYPCLIHETPHHFGVSNSQAFIGLQMASAYIGTTLMPPIFGFLAEKISIRLYPVYLLLFAFVLLANIRKLNRLPVYRS